MSAQRAPSDKERIERAAAALARRQFGILTRAQLRDLGFKDAAITRRMASGMLIQCLPGTFRVPSVKPTWEQRAMAALMWAGGDATLVGLSAAWAWRLDVDRPQVIEVATSRRRVSPASWLRLRRTNVRRVKVDGLWVLGIAPTLIDLAALVDTDALEEAVESALRRELSSFTRLDLSGASLCGHGLRGCSQLRRLLARRGDIPATDSRFETRFFALLRRSGLPLPERQYEISAPDGRVTAIVDFAYPSAKVAIETDGWSFHSSKKAWQRDVTKANDLARCGWSLLRFTYADLRERPRDVLGRTSHAIGLRLFDST